VSLPKGLGRDGRAVVARPAPLAGLSPRRAQLPSDQLPLNGLTSGFVLEYSPAGFGFCPAPDDESPPGAQLGGRAYRMLQRKLEARPGEPEEWQQAALFGDLYLYLTAAELTELGEQVDRLLYRHLDRMTRPELRPPGARLVSYIHVAAPHQGPGGTGREPAAGQDAR